MAEIPPARQEYTVEEIVNEGKAELFAAFESAYRQWLQQKIDEWPKLKTTMQLILSPSTIKHYDDKVIPEIIHAPNFNRYKNDLERACAAAKQLAPRYDVGMGIAKKGLWMSFIFNLYGLKTRDTFMSRAGERRLAVPLDICFRSDFSGDNVLIFDNDAVTGNTIKETRTHLEKAYPKSVDALLIYARTELKQEYYNQIKSQFKNNPTVLGERDGVVIIDTRSEVKPYVRKLMTLQTDYEPRPELLTGLAKKLGVHYEPKA